MSDHLQAQNNLPYSRPSSPMRPHPVRVGFCGLGAMGSKIARNLANSLPSPLLVYNRSRSKAEALVKEVGEEKVRIADTPGSLVKECDVIISILASDSAVEEVYKSYIEALEHCKHDVPKIFVEQSTIYPKLAADLDKSVTRYPHAHFVACPVFGPPAVADKAQLILAMSGDYRSKKEIAYLLVPAIGNGVIDLGEGIQKAHTLKLIGNSMIMGVIEMMAEAMTLGEKAGIKSETVFEFIKLFFPVQSFKTYGNKLVNNEFDGQKGFSLDGGLKDATHCLNLGRELKCPVPMVSIIQQHLLTAQALQEKAKAEGTAEYEVLDWSALCYGPRIAAGFEPSKGNKVGDDTVIAEDDGEPNKHRDFSKKLLDKIKTTIHKG